VVTKKKKTIKKAATKKPAASVKATTTNVVKKAVKKKAATKKAVKKIAIKKTPAINNKIKVTLEQQHKMICEAAYYISLGKTHETVNPTEDWLQAEAAINQICTVHSK
jgi:urease accessory protein UreF